jgi:hypothetical protein
VAHTAMIFKPASNLLQSACRVSFKLSSRRSKWSMNTSCEGVTIHTVKKRARAVECAGGGGGGGGGGGTCSVLRLHS